MLKKKVLLACCSLLIAGGSFAQTQEEGQPVASPVRHSSTESILSVAPIQFTENGVGLSFSYEKWIDNAGIISYNLPVIATFNLNSSTNLGDHQDAMFYIAPGLKFYPTSSHGTLKYAIGPSLVIGAGEKTKDYGYYDNTTYQHVYDYKTQSKFMLGVMVSNSLNINPTAHFYLGLDFGFGFTYINRVGGSNDGLTGIVQSGFKIGYRF